MNATTSPIGPAAGVARRWYSAVARRSLDRLSAYTLTAPCIWNGEGAPVTKRLIDLDDDLLAKAQRELNTTGVSDTVRAALRQAASAGARARQVAWLREGGLEALTDPAERAAVWRGSPAASSTPRRPP